MPWAVGIAWIVIGIVSGALFRETDSVTLIVELLFTTISLFAFLVGWYKGNMPLKIFLVIQFVSLRELAFWAGYMASSEFLGQEKAPAFNLL